ncbi:MAG: MarC family protein, partial [bacterium]
IDSAAIFAALTVDNDRRERRVFAIRGTAIAAAILLVFALVGEALLERLGISLAALRTAGGILLLLMGIDMVFARNSGAVSTTSAEQREAESRQDISVFPLATPLLAGPGTMGAVILLTANTQGEWELRMTVVATLFVVLLIALLALLSAAQLQRLLGVTGLRVISRVFGVLLSALAVQFIFDGIRGSGLLA